MALQIRPDYVNPLTMLADKKSSSRLLQPAVKQSSQTDKVTELQNKQQQLQNQMLLLKASGTDSAGATAETQKVIEAELEKVATELRTAKGNSVQDAEQLGQSQLNAARHSHDLYEPEKVDTASPGVYQVEKDDDKGYKVSFSPYSDD